MRIKLIINPTSGGKKAKKYLPEITEILDKNNHLDISITADISKIKEIAYEAASNKNYDLLIAGGGDGTLNIVINAIKAASSSPEKPIDIPLGFIPLGISNVFAIEAGISQNPIKATRDIIQGTIKKLDLGKLTMPDKICYFISMAGIGFDAEVVKNVNPTLKHMLGAGAFIIRGIYDLLTYKPMPFTIQTDNGLSENLSMAIICNTKHYGGKFTITPEAKLTDGYLSVCLFKKYSRRDLLSFVFSVVTNNINLKSKHSTILKAKKIKLTYADNKNIPIQIDGDIAGHLPAEFEIYPQSLNVILPEQPL